MNYFTLLVTYIEFETSQIVVPLMYFDKYVAYFNILTYK